MPIPCTVWDFIFQNINTANAWKVRCAPNSVFNEVTWFFPSTNSTENDSYVKYNVIENTWDCGLMNRTAWMDISVVGNPMGTDSGGFLYQHETGVLTPGAGAPSFTSGWWAITEGNDLAFVDYVIPDFRWGFYGAAQSTAIDLTFYSADYPGDVPTVHGPYTITQATEYITPRIRGRLMSISATTQTPGFWRLGRLRYRYALSGRR